MQFKKILVFVMAMVMVIGTCAPAAYAATEIATRSTRANHSHEVIESDLYQNITGVVEILSELSEMDYNEAIAYGYAYVNDNGYVEAVMEALRKAEEIIENTDLDNLEIDKDLKDKLCLELSSASLTLEEIAVLVSDYAPENCKSVIAALPELTSKLLHWYENVYNTYMCAHETLTSDVRNAMENAKKEVELAINALCETFTAKVAEYAGIASDAIYNASHGKYELTENSFYVALGDAIYAQKLAELLYLNNKYTQFGLENVHYEDLANADIVTVKFNNGEFFAFAYAQTMGLAAQIVKSNEDLMCWYHNDVIGAEVKKTLGGYGISLEAELIELNWDKYLNDDAQDVLNKALRELKLAFIEKGVPEYCYIDINPAIEKVLVAGDLDLPGISTNVTPIEIPVAELAVYYVENLLYSYAQFTERTLVTLNSVYEASPDATVIITGVNNPFEGLFRALDHSNPAVDSADKVIKGVVDGLNAQLYAYALLREKTIFVNSDNAVDIYNALDVVCHHVYDDCIDVDCNRCAEVREAPGHTFVDYVSNNDATCTNNATGTSKCEYCDSTDTKILPNTTLPHEWKNATCTDPQTCKECGETRGSAL